MHLSLKGAVGRNPLLNKVGKPLLSIDDAAAAYSLRSLGSGNPRVARVRRSSDDAEKDFYAADMGSGSVADWVNGKQDTTLPCDVASAAAAYSLRSVNSNYTGSVVRVRRSSDDAEKDFTASDISGGSLVDWVNEDVVTYQSDFSSGTDGWGGSGDEDGVSVSQNSTGIGGEINTIVAAVDTSNGVHTFWDDLDRYNGTGLFKIKFDVYIPSSQNIKGVQVLVSSEGSNAFHPILNPTLDSWTTYQSNEFIRTAADSNRIYFYLTDESGRDYTGNGTDFAHFKNIEITALTSNGHVTTWYDQSGNGNNATQSTAGSQPKIVDGGVLVSDGIEFDGTEDIALVTGSFSLTQTYTTLSVSHTDDASTSQGVWSTASSIGSSFNAISFFRHDGGFAVNSGASVTTAGTINYVADRTYLQSNIVNGVSSSVFVDGATGVTGNAGSNNPSGILILGLFRSGASIAALDGGIKELIIYNSDQSANRFKIESNINNHYGLYTNANDGFVTSWYDQSGNDNHATQSTAGSQPKIVDGGVHLGELDFDGVDDFFDTSCSLSAPFQVFFAGLIDNASKRQNFFDTSSGSRVLASWRPDASPDALRLQSVNAPTGQLTYSNDGTFTNDVSFVLNFLLNGLNSEISKNGTLLVTGDAGSASINSLRIAKDTQSTGEYCYSGTIFEIIIYNSDQSSNRTAIETNINNHYDIY